MNFLPPALLLAASMLVAPSATTTAAVAAGPDDPATTINESASLDASRFEAVGSPERPPSPMELAQAYADERGWECTSPSGGELDDTYLAILVHPLTFEPISTRIVEVDFDEALESQGKRTILLACDT